MISNIDYWIKPGDLIIDESLLRLGVQNVGIVLYTKKGRYITHFDCTVMFIDISKLHEKLIIEDLSVHINRAKNQYIILL